MMATTEQPTAPTTTSIDVWQDDAELPSPPSPLPPSTPILEALTWLRDHTRVTVADYEALTHPIPVGVWTLGDLRVVVERGEIADDRIARKLKRLL